MEAEGRRIGNREEASYWVKGDKDRRVGSELSNLIFPKVPDISLHHELVLPPDQSKRLQDQINNILKDRRDGGIE